MIENIGIPILAFLLGALPTAYLAGRVAGGMDIRTVGSGNAGALNTYRSLGRKAGIIVMAVDTSKGALALAIGMAVGASDLAMYVAAALAVMGHNFSPFTGLRGGTGGATVLGISLLMVWHVTLISIAIGLLVFLVRRNSLLALTVIFVALNVLTAATGQSAGTIVTCLVLSAVVIGTQLLRTYTNLVPAIKRGDWRHSLEHE